METPVKDLEIHLSLKSGDGRLVTAKGEMPIETDLTPRIVLDCTQAGIGTGHLLYHLIVIQGAEKHFHPHKPTSLESMLSQAFALGYAMGVNNKKSHTD